MNGLLKYFLLILIIIFINCCEYKKEKIIYENANFNNQLPEDAEYLWTDKNNYTYFKLGEKYYCISELDSAFAGNTIIFEVNKNIALMRSF